MEELIRFYNYQVNISVISYRNRPWWQNLVCVTLLLASVLLLVGGILFKQAIWTTLGVVAVLLSLAIHHYFNIKIERALYPDYLNSENRWDRRLFRQNKIDDLIALIYSEFPGKESRQALSVQLKEHTKELMKEAKIYTGCLAALMSPLWVKVIYWNLDQVKSPSDFWVLTGGLVLLAFAIALLIREFFLYHVHYFSVSGTCKELVKIVEGMKDPDCQC